jgi:hypothetical protein
MFAMQLKKPRFQRASMANGVSTATARLNPKKPRKQSCSLENARDATDETQLIQCLQCNDLNAALKNATNIAGVSSGNAHFKP